MKITLNLSKINHEKFIKDFSDTSWKISKKKDFRRIHPDKIYSDTFYTFEVDDFLERSRKERIKRQ